MAADDFRNRYVLGFYSDTNGSVTITIEATDITSAINIADDHMKEKLGSAQTGEHFSAALWFNSRIVKNYPEQVKF